jgi:hypothetical protein
MAEAQKIENAAVRLTGIDELSPKLAALRSSVERFKQNLAQTGLGSLDIAGLVKGGGLAAPFISGIQSALAFKGEVADVNATVGSGVPQVAAQGLKDFSASMDKVSVAFGSALLPAVTAVVVGLEPLLAVMAQVLADNPQLVQGLAAGAVAFSAIQAAVTGASQALGLLQLALSANPIMLVAVGIGVVAGLIVANWQPISAFFVNLWNDLKVAAQPIVGFFQTLFAWSPLGLIAANWAPLTGLFAALWDLLRALSMPVMTFLQGLFNWSPLGLIIANWGSISEVFSAIWSSVQTQALAMFTVLGGLFDWSPLGQIVQAWEPVLEWFSSLWDKLGAIIASIREMLGGTVGGLIAKITGGVVELTEQQQQRNAQDGQPTALLMPPAVSLLSTNLASSSSSLLQQTAANNRTQLNGDLRVSFDNAPAGLRVDQPRTNQPGLSVTPRVGYRSLSLGGSNELA